jgi:hypothetical protein
MQYGLDQLGAARYKKLVISDHPRLWSFGTFLEVDGFGKTYDVIEAIAKIGVPLIRVQMMWKDDHRFTSRDLPEIEKRAKLLAPIITRYPSVKWYVSPCCEHELSAVGFEPFAKAVLKHIPSADIVNSPNTGKGHVSTKYVNEYHHEKPRGGRIAFSFDGANCVDSNVEEYKRLYAKAEYFMFWNCQCNGLRKLPEPGEPRIPRKDRKHFPISKQIDSWIWLGTHEKGATKLPRGAIYKSHSDQHAMPPAGKDQKPVWILKEKYREIVLKASNGQVIDTAKYFGTFSGGGYRYYHTQWGFELAQKAIRIQGHSVCDVYANGRKIGTVDAAFRSGSYR